MACERLMNCRFKRPSALYRLICLPWAGGGSSFYAGWGKLMSENIEVVGVTLPGRESRFNDKCCDDMEEILTDITNTITSQYMDKPFILWGHSMGSLLAFELACRLKSQTGQEPKKMYLSGISAPHSPMRKKVHIDRTQTDQQFIGVMSRLGGTPKEVLENEEMMKIFLPCIRADYTMLDGFTFTNNDGPPPLSCPISFFDGEDDSKHDTEGKHLEKFDLRTILADNDAWGPFLSPRSKQYACHHQSYQQGLCVRKWHDKSYLPYTVQPDHIFDEEPTPVCQQNEVSYHSIPIKCQNDLTAKREIKMYS